MALFSALLLFQASAYRGYPRFDIFKLVQNVSEEGFDSLEFFQYRLLLYMEPALAHPSVLHIRRYLYKLVLYARLFGKEIDELDLAERDLLLGLVYIFNDII